MRAALQKKRFTPTPLALAAALSVALAAVPVAVLSLVVAFFLPERPLRVETHLAESLV